MILVGDESFEELLKPFVPHLSKRGRIVVEHILKHGLITTEELEKNYGYSHPPRAARDVREGGIPLETIRVESSDGRSIGAYQFGDLTKIDQDKLGGRKIFPKKLKNELIEKYGERCTICMGRFKSRYLQIDHKIPYEVLGDKGELDWDMKDYMLLCSSCNRAKSWSCEHCVNWTKEKSSKICKKCYWGNPENYAHIALDEVRRMDIIWSKNEVATFEKLKRIAKNEKTPIPDYVKILIEKQIENQ